MTNDNKTVSNWFVSQSLASKSSKPTPLTPGSFHHDNIDFKSVALGRGPWGLQQSFVAWHSYSRPKEAGAFHVQSFVLAWSGPQTQWKGSIMPLPAGRMEQWTGKDVCGCLHRRSNENLNRPGWEQTIWWWHFAKGQEAHSWWVNPACLCILNNLLDWFLEKCNQSILRLMWGHGAFPSHLFPARDYASELTSILLVKEPQFQAHFTEIWTLRHGSSF